MWGLVLFFGLTAAQDPVRIGIMALLIARPQPMRNLLAYWLGLMATGFGAALAALFLLHDLMFPVMRVVTSVATSPVVPLIQTVFGVLALSAAAMLALPSSVRQAAHALTPGGDSSSSTMVPQSDTPTVFSRRPLSGLLKPRSQGMAFVAGMCTSTQIVEFWGAMMVILASGAGAGRQVSAALMFTLVAFAIVEIPLVSYLVSPGKTQAGVMQLQNWLGAHRRLIFVFVLAVVGVWMVTKGVSTV